MIIAQGSLILSTVSIASGQTTSGIISTEGSSLCGIQLPAAFTGTSLTFLAATVVGGPYQPVYNKSGQVSYTVAAGQFIAIDPVDFYGIVFLKIVSNASEAGARSLICSMKGI
jgi:hypothetical protein